MGSNGRGEHFPVGFGHKQRCAFLHGRRQGQAGAIDGKTLIVEQMTDLADQQNFVGLIVSTITPTLHRLQLGKFLLPIAQNMGLDGT